MRTDSTLQAAQKLMGDAKAKILLSTGGVAAETYYIDSGTDRIMAINHTEQEWSQVAQVVIQDSSHTVADLAREGYKAHISWGYGADYSLCAPLWCIAQKTDSRGGSIITALSLAGTFNLMNEDRASCSFTPDASDAKTVKDLLKELCAGRFSAWAASTAYSVGDFVRATTTNGKVFKCTTAGTSGGSEPTWETEVGDTTTDGGVTWTCRGAEMTCYGDTTAYTATFDDTTGIIDTFAPKDSFRIYLNDSRLSKIKQLMKHIGYKCRVEGDEEIHFFIPTTSGSTYDEEYDDAVTGHNFFEKGVRKRVIIPGYFVVSSHPDHLSPFAGWTGYAKDTGYDALPTDLQKRDHKYFRVTGNTQCTNIATNLLLHKQMDAEKGHGFAIMNCLQEVFDYVNITDSKVGDTRAGNIGYINRKYLATGRPEDFSMEFRFGSVAPGQYLGTMPPATTGISTAALAIGQMSLWDAVNAIFAGDPETGWLGLAHYMPSFDERITEAKDEITQIEPDAGIPSGGMEGGINWRSIFDGSVDTPTSVDWALEAGLPFTYTGTVYFSPIIEEVPNVFVVYVIDRSASQFWKYNITQKEWTKLSTTNLNTATSAYRTLVLNPLGTQLWCIDGDAPSTKLAKYVIATDTWSLSTAAPDILTQTADIRSFVFEDDDKIWTWVRKGTSQNQGKCIRYVPSTDTWTQFANDTGVLTIWQARCAAIKGTTIAYTGHIGSAASKFYKYTIATDTYSEGAGSGNYAWAYDKDKLWFFNLTTKRLGYIDTADDSVNANHFAVNPDGGAFGTYGINDASTSVIGAITTTAPELMSVISGGTYLLGTLYASGWTPVLIEKPDDNFVVLVVNTADNITLSFDHTVQTTLWDGTWKFYYPQTGDYTQVKVKYGVS